MIQQIIIIAHVIVCILMVGIILLQQGKGAEAGASFGSGASQTVLGATGAANLLTRLTTFLTVLFFALSFALAYYADFTADQAGQIEINVPAAEQQSVPAQAPTVDGDVPVMNAQPQTSSTEVPTAPAAQDVPTLDE